MMKIEGKLAEMGLELPPPIKTPPGVALPFSFVRIHAGIAYISGHGPQSADGSVAGPFGKRSAAMSASTLATKRRGRSRFRCSAASSGSLAIWIG